MRERVGLGDREGGDSRGVVIKGWRLIVVVREGRKGSGRVVQEGILEGLRGRR